MLAEAKVELNLNVSPFWAGAAVGHERQHARVSRILGVSEVDFLVQFTRIPTTGYPDGELHVIASTRAQFCAPVPRLSQALIAAYPSCPSDSDMAVVQRLGYENIDQVAEYARDMNRDFGLNLPVPLWAREPDLL